MIAIRRADARGRVGRGPATSYLTFSCEQFKDPEHTGFRTLCAINEDVLTPGAGVSHAAPESVDMLSCLLEGELDLVDENGARERLQPGSIARRHSSQARFDPAGNQAARVLQVWLKPALPARALRTDAAVPATQERRGKWRLIASPDGRDQSLSLKQDTYVYNCVLKHGDRLEHALPAHRHMWVQVLRGVVEVNGHLLTASDGAAVSGEECLNLFARQDSEVMAFEMD
jgi:redox-sensitive bicupin YhaK (pirin superfamily)